MRFIYKILFGLIIFNALIILFSGFFVGTLETDKAVDVAGNSTLSQYKDVDQGLFSNMWTNALLVGSAVFSLSILLGVLAKQVALFAGIGAFVALVTSVYSSVNSVIGGLGDYPIVSGLITIVTIVIGLIAVFSVIEMLNAQRGVD